MKQINAKPRRTIPLGHRGENEARQIIFDLTDYISTYGPGTARLLHQREGDPAPYIVPAVQDEATLTWTVTDEDTAAPGTGSAELQWMVENALAKSDIWCTKTKAALDDGATAPPTGAEGWYQQLIAYIDSLRGEGVSEEQIAAAVEAYLLEHPVDVPVTSVNGKTGAVELTAEDVGALARDDLQAGVDAALERAKASGEFDGPPGDPGTDGVTPHIGDNGNWYLGETDTGKPSRGETGPAGADGRDGADGHPGADGKSAYQYAVEGGYTGTESEFAAKLAEEMPTALPNPNALTFTGAVAGRYDGSEPLEVNIPSGGGSSSWETVIDTTLTEEAGIDTGEMPGKTEMLCVFAVPKSDAAISLAASSKAFGKALPGVSMGSASYGKIGFIFGRKVDGHATAIAASGDTTSTAPSLDTTPRAVINLNYIRITDAPTDVPLKITSALPAGTIIKVFVR